MRKAGASRVRQVSNFILVALGFGFIYWFTECVVQVYLFDADRVTLDLLRQKGFWDRLITRLSTPTPNELWVRLLMMIAFVLFGGFVQHTVRLRLRAESNLERLNRELEQRVEDRTARLAAANRELEAFNYTVSHDLRSPLRIILGLSRDLLESAADPAAPSFRQHVAAIHQSSEKMSRLIDDLLALSRSARRGLQLAQIDVGELARVVFDELMVAHGNRSVALAVTEMPPAHGDLSMLHEAMTNLLANALKFTSQNPKARIEVGGRIDADRHEHVYYVRDNGVGFDPKYAHRLFRVFQRLHSDEAFEGTGVGLAIVQRILERHGGRTWAEGAVGQGATFYFALPATARATPAPEFAQPEYAAQEARA
ncbi:MAG TPA: ATP-binding protein [Planctomycetota bacterium]|nr:ATP-binding protein [Planctomycetota bacterium]HRT96533.1 ATP-binding protein [Planctomycetota bacterium]